MFSFENDNDDDDDVSINDEQEFQQFRWKKNFGSLHWEGIIVYT